MDLLFSKYASPFLFVDGMIQTGRFSEFVIEFIEIDNEKRQEEQMWQLYLHKVFNKSYNEFKESLDGTNEKMSESQLETTVQESKNLLDNFIPEERG